MVCYGCLTVKPFLVPSGGMVPMINPGGVVLTVPVQPDAIKVGEIIEYRNTLENINIVHRVIAIRGISRAHLLFSRVRPMILPMPTPSHPNK